MSRVNVTIEVDLPDGVELLEYERHGDGHAFHVAWTLPDQCRCDRCGHEEPICLDAKNTFYTVRDLDLWGQPSFWGFLLKPWHSSWPTKSPTTTPKKWTHNASSTASAWTRSA